MKTEEQMNAGEKDFLDEYTRVCLVGWCDQQMQTGAMPSLEHCQEPYLAYARKKGWISKKEHLVIGAGFAVAAAQLRK